jgi:hypothetical protein
VGGCHLPYYSADCSHVRLFEYWIDATHTTYVAYDFGATPVKHQVYVWGAPGEYDYVPIRYDPR